MAKVISLLTGAGLGAVAMYVLDPEAGTKRRALAHDKMTEVKKKMSNVVSATPQELDNRASGIASEVRSRFTDEQANDEVLAAKIRSKLGSLVRQPGGIATEVSNGRIVLSGSVFEDEVQQLIDGISAVRGVTSVQNNLAVDESEQGSRSKSHKPTPFSEVWDIMQHRWSPATRFLVGTAGLVSLGLIAYSFSDESRQARGSSDWQKKPQPDQDASAGWGI